MKKSFFAAAWLCLSAPALAQGPATSTTAQSRSLHGTVTDIKNSRIPGATVQIKGSKEVSVTDNNGNFTFTRPHTYPLTLSISNIGFQSQEVVATGPAVDVHLQESQSQLNQVVVVGYGTLRRSDITGSVTSVSKVALAQPAASFDNLLQGSVSGVSVTQASGQPGSAANIRIRGGNSISFSNEPLYVIDGFIVYTNNSYTSTGAGSGPAVNALSTVNPSDIESIEVLKDAAATAIYGSHGANGVIIITTRRGKKGSDDVNYAGYYGTQQVDKKLPLLNAKQWGSLVNDINVSDGVAKTYTDAQLDALGQGYDWQSAGLRHAPIQNHELSVAGGDDKSRYLISGNYFDQDGILRSTYFKRYSGRINYERNVSDRFRVGVNAFGSSSKQQQPGVGVGPLGPAFSNLLLTAPVAKIYNADGSYYTGSPFFGTPNTNPLQDITAVTNVSDLTRVLANIYGEYRLTRDLKLKVAGGADLINTKQNYYAPSYTSFGNPGGYASVGQIKSTTWLNENTLTYDHTFGSDHSLIALAGFTTQKATDESAVASVKNFSNDLTGYNNLGAGSTPVLPTSNAHTWTMNSWLARINYSYLHKYNLTLSARADGSSVLGANNKWGYFPSVGFSWNASQEDFFAGIRNTVSNLKVRLSAGKTGNSGIPAYSSLAAVIPTNYYFGGTLVTGFAPNQLANPDLKWESTAQYNAGVDIGFLQDRISVVADVYYKKTSDLLLNVPLPLYTGYASAIENVGSVENKGFEIGINTENIRTSNFSWKTNLVFAHNANKVLSLGPGIDNFIPTVQLGQISPMIVKVGLPVGTFWGYTTDGLLTKEDIANGVPLLTGVSQQVGDRKYVALDGHKSVTIADKHNLGNAQPKFTFGFSNSLSYKGFDLNFFLQGSYGNKLFNQYQQILERPTLSQNASALLADRWSETNPNGKLPKATNAPVAQVTDRYVEDGSYLRLKNVSFGYSLPKSALSRIHVKQIRVYVQAQNLFTITHYTGLNPEVNYFDGDNTKQGIDQGLYPAAKTFLAGANFTF